MAWSPSVQARGKVKVGCFVKCTENFDILLKVYPYFSLTFPTTLNFQFQSMTSKSDTVCHHHPIKKLFFVHVVKTIHYTENVDQIVFNSSLPWRRMQYCSALAKRLAGKSISKTRMWANAQRDGRPAEHRWRPLFSAAKFEWRSLLDCRAVTLPRRITHWN